jgi:uncharacterized BrkB/YihY/UPF0761 family membrane protein
MRGTGLWLLKGAGSALMVWLYLTGFAILLGAALNAELAKVGEEGKPPGKKEPSAITKLDSAA